MIFEEKERTRTEPKQPGEDEFAFYDSAGGQACDDYRALLNGWIADYPEAERAELVACFRRCVEVPRGAPLNPSAPSLAARP
jgi:hypothetical protein